MTSPNQSNSARSRRRSGRPPRIVFVAPGAGLGHLVRTSAIGLALAREGVEPVLVTNSPFAEGLARLTGIATETIVAGLWSGSVTAAVDGLAPSLVVLDTFPYGLHGEWRNRCRPGGRIALLARILKMDAYAERVGSPLRADPAQFVCTVCIEPLPDGYTAWLGAVSDSLVSLPGRIRMGPDPFAVPVPDELAEIVASGSAHLIVHSGPPDELERLVATAEGQTAGSGTQTLVAVSPWPRAQVRCRTFEYFPASRLFPGAARICIGAGYNLVAETAPFAAKTTSVPFTRMFDDQHLRLTGPRVGPENGCALAAEALLRRL